MKSIQRWIKVLLVAAIAMLAACSSAPKKSISSIVRDGQVMESLKAGSVVSPLLKKDYEQALVYMKQGEYDGANKLLKMIIDKEPHLAGPYINLGIIYLNGGEQEEAEKWFLQARSRSTKNPEIENYLGIIYRQQGRFQDAELAYKKAIAINPMFAKAYLNLGVLYDLYLPNYSAAMNNYKQYQVFNPEDKRVDNWIIELGQRMQASN